jgi:ABC-2 type transport system permease protein
MKALVFADRNLKELFRNPAILLCGAGIPSVLIAVFALMKQSIPGMGENFAVDRMAPSMAIFGLSFLAMFLGVLMTGDKKTSFLMRLYATPMTGADYLVGYSLPIFPLALLQTLLCFAFASLFGLSIGTNFWVVFLVLLPVTLLFLSIGLFMGAVLTTDSQVSGFSTIFINAAVFLGGAFLPLDLIGGAFKRICYLLPFVHANDAMRAAISGDYAGIAGHLLWVLGYAALVFAAAVLVFRKRMKA